MQNTAISWLNFKFSHWRGDGRSCLYVSCTKYQNLCFFPEQGCSQVFQRGVRVKKICKDGAKCGRFWLQPLLTSTLLDRADSLSGCSRAISLSSRAISSSSSWSSPLLPRQAPLVSVSAGSGESRSLHCLLASSSSTTASAAFGEETPVQGRHEPEDPVEKNSVMDLYPPGIRRRFDILTSLPTCSSYEYKWAVRYIMTPSYVMITGKKGGSSEPPEPPLATPLQRALLSTKHLQLMLPGHPPVRYWSSHLLSLLHI